MTTTRQRRLLVAGLTLLATLAGEAAGLEIYDQAYAMLDAARRDKVAQLRRFCDRTHDLAQAAARDHTIASFLSINLQYARAVARNDAPAILIESVRELRASFDRYYLEHYSGFYDLLFVSREGEIVYTLRKESDLHAAARDDNPADNPLLRCLREKPAREVFIDYHYYRPSGEAAAFFVEPVRIEGGLAGWVVLQCAINKINSIYAWIEDLGETGEMFLVNQQGVLLTESSFEDMPAILSIRLDNRNIDAKFAAGQGHLCVTDYRGHEALTSFEVVSFLGIRWLTVAKVDKAQVLTGEYLRHRDRYAARLAECLNRAAPPPARALEPPPDRAVLRVDMDEFQKAGRGERLETSGISTCTGLLAAYPGKLGYLAHISPHDKVYGHGNTNLVGQMIRRIKRFDVYRSDRDQILLAVAANHLDSLFPIVDKALEEGFLLSQFRVFYYPRADSLALRYDYPENRLQVTWQPLESDGGPRGHTLDDGINLCALLETVVAPSDDSPQTAAKHP